MLSDLQDFSYFVFITHFYIIAKSLIFSETGAIVLRLGRRMIKLIELINDFRIKGIEFVSLENNMDTTNPMGMLLFNICAAFAEMERELIRERVKTGLNAVKAKGRKSGRPKALTKEKLQNLKSFIKSGEFSVTQICKMLSISRSVYYREKNSL